MSESCGSCLWRLSFRSMFAVRRLFKLSHLWRDRTTHNGWYSAIWIFGICASCCAATEIKYSASRYSFTAFCCCAAVWRLLLSHVLRVIYTSRDKNNICFNLILFFVSIFAHLSLRANERDIYSRYFCRIASARSHTHTHAVITHFVH